MYFEDGSSFSITGMTASGQLQGGCRLGTGWLYSGYTCGDPITASYSTVPPRKRSQTFTFYGTATGSGAAYFNSNTFLLDPENIATPYNSSGPMAFYFRQVPLLSAAGGSATILTDDNYVKGPRNASPELGSVGPQFAYGTTAIAKYLRAAGERMYGWDTASSGYDNNGLAFIGPLPGNEMITFGGTYVGTQLLSNQQYENTATKPTSTRRISAPWLESLLKILVSAAPRFAGLRSLPGVRGGLGNSWKHQGVHERLRWPANNHVQSVTASSVQAADHRTSCQGPIDPSRHDFERRRHQRHALQPYDVASFQRTLPRSSNNRPLRNSWRALRTRPTSWSAGRMTAITWTWPGNPYECGTAHPLGTETSGRSTAAFCIGTALAR